MNSAEMNNKFAIENHIRFKDTDSGICIAEIANAQCSADISLQGGHLMTWHPKSQAQPVVWLSPLAKPTPGKSIRGGIPVCWPWFGPHATESSYPAHGFARTTNWTVTASRAFDHGITELEMELQDNEQTRTMWPSATRLSIGISVGERLKITLSSENLGDEEVTLSEALHTYFRIGDITDVLVDGLDECEYIDKVAAGERCRQNGPIRFSGETDRVYVNTQAQCVIVDNRLKRKIRVVKSGSRSTVVWTPWTEKADKMGDLGPDGWRTMVCVESANALDNKVSVAGGATHTLSVEYWVEDL
jgi:D-hexose-6-phosphate mutarotase